MSYQVGVLEALRDYGLDVGLVPGYATRGSSVFAPRGHVCHHDAGARWWEYPPPIFTDGRTDVPPPLANFALQHTGKVWFVAAGRANHAGLGSWRGLVGNTAVWGTEASNDGRGQVWPDEQIAAYVRLCQATADYSGFSAEMVCRHAEWAPTRKIDAWGPWESGPRWETNMSTFRAMVARTDTTQGWGTMTDAEIRQEFANQDDRIVARVVAELAGTRTKPAGLAATQQRMIRKLNRLLAAAGLKTD